VDVRTMQQTDQGVRAGFAAVDLRESFCSSTGDLVTVDGLAVKAPWSVWHAKCAPWALKSLNPYSECGPNAWQT